MNDAQDSRSQSTAGAQAALPSAAPNRTLYILFVPMVVLAAASLAMSVVTAIYINWLDEHYQSILRDNVSTIRSTAVMQHALWELRVAATTFESGELETSGPYTSAVANFQQALKQAKTSSISSEEHEKVELIADAFDEYLKALRAVSSDLNQRQQLALLARDISTYCDQLQQINQSQIDTRTHHYTKWSTAVGNIRMILVIAGPVIGVWLGYRAASQVSNRLAAIHFRLEGAAMELGKVDVLPSTNGDIEAIDFQVRKIVERFEQMIKSLEGTRREAIRNERLAAVGTLAAGVAHEIRNPLTAVKLLVQSMRIKGPGASSAESLRVVEEEVVRMEDTIQQLLDFARPPKPRRLRANVSELVERAVNLVRGRGQESSISFELDLPTTCELTCDPEQLHQVFVNLLLNGIDAMPKGGILGVQLYTENGDPREVVVVVEDEGTGISPQVMEHVFEPFVTTKARGTGLGLAITRRLVEEHGGTVVAENRSPRGARFIVRLPDSAIHPGGPQPIISPQASLFPAAVST